MHDPPTDRPAPADAAHGRVPGTVTWAVTANMDQPRFGSPFVLLPSGSVLVSGGLDRAISQTAELYDPGG